MTWRFTKMHGLGNDFVVLDAVRQTIDLQPAQARWLADRHFGVGCDQILLVERARNPAADFRYRIFNADGSEVSQCGNGARCFARFVAQEGLTDRREITVETASGLLHLHLEGEHDVRVNMGVPHLGPHQIPLHAAAPSLRYRVGDSYLGRALLRLEQFRLYVVDARSEAPLAQENDRFLHSFRVLPRTP